MSWAQLGVDFFIHYLSIVIVHPGKTETNGKNRNAKANGAACPTRVLGGASHLAFLASTSPRRACQSKNGHRRGVSTFQQSARAAAAKKAGVGVAGCALG